jgi:hypothetical protein
VEAGRVTRQVVSPELTVFTVAPSATVGDLVETTLAFMDGGPTRLVLWDLRSSNLGRAAISEFPGMVGRFLEAAGPGRSGGRSAFVVAREVDLGVMRMLVSYAAEGGYRVRMRVFQDDESARAWLVGEAGEVG